MAAAVDDHDTGGDQQPAPFELAIPLHETLHSLRVAQGLTVRQEENAQLVGKAYGAYMQALSRKIAGLRLRLKLSMRTRGSKELVVPKFDRCERDEQVLLEAYVAERAWAAAMHAKQLSITGYDEDHDGDNDDSGAGIAKLPRRCRMRFRKAAKVATALKWVTLSKESSTEKLKSELQAFAAFLCGLDLEARSCEKQALKAFSESARIYGELSRFGHAWQQDVFGLRVAEAKVAIQRCRYRLKVREEFDDADGSDNGEYEDGIATAVQVDRHLATNSSSRSDDILVDWCGRKVAVSTEKLRSKFKDWCVLSSSALSRLCNETVDSARRLFKGSPSRGSRTDSRGCVREWRQSRDSETSPDVAESAHRL